MKVDLFWQDLIQLLMLMIQGEAGFTGSLVVAEFENLKEARAWADSDPYVKAGVYSSVVVKTFNKVLP